MIKPKKPIAFVCAAALLLSPTGALGASPSDFVDFPNDWSQGAMTAAVENGLLGGVGDGRIAPQGEVTRAQMAAIINRAFGAEKQASLSSYSDVAADAWYAVDMAKAVQMGTFSGTGNGLLEPDRAITREEAFSVLARAFALEAGDDSSLASFSDGAQVSSWAKGSVSAMVAAGYVNGSDGNRLNPQQTITRAEFAAVMSKIVAQYIDAEDVQRSRSLSIDGNVIVRESVDLSGYTINGDVIIADAADAASLSGVTITGRLVVRGASESLSVEDSSIGGVIFTNPNSAAVLDVDDKSDLGTVTALSDFILAGGSLDKLSVAESATITVENDASIGEITVNADDVRVTGDGTVEKVLANGDDVHVDIVGTEVTAAKGTSGVTAGGENVFAGESTTVGDSAEDGDNDKNPGSTGGSTGGSSNSGGNTGGNTGGTTGGGENTDPTPGGDEEESVKLINAETTRLIDLGWSQYVVVQFADGHSLSDTKLTIDGIDVTSAFTPVTDDGSIVKWEITDLNPAQLIATSDGESQSDTLSDNANPTPPTVETNTAPDYMIAHGAVSYFDYYLSNYDENGQVRVDPTKTTFNISGQEVTDVPAFYSADAELKASDGQYGVSGTVTIEFAQDTDADKAWFAAVPENKTGTVQLIADNENQNVISDNLSYTKNNDGTITIPLGQENFYSNGRYNVRIYSDGHDDALVPIHVVNETAPSLSLTGSGSFASGENIHFSIENMTYGATAPIYAVELTRPDGTTVSLEKFTDWAQIGDSLVLYNDNTNNTLYNGPYTITVHSNGFKDMSLPFTITGGTDVQTAASRSTRSLNVDAVSRATSGGGSSESGGSGAVTANLKFDADLLINAQILVDMGMANDAAKGIADRWKYEMAGWDQVYSKTDAEHAYDWSDYITKVNQARTRGEYLSFAEYVNKKPDWDLTGAPYAVKSVLEDNLLGETQLSGTWKGQQTPTVTLVDESGKAIDAVKEGSAARLKFSDAAYLKALNSLNINSEPFDMDDTLYSVSGDTLIIKNEALDFGTNNLVICADGYRAKYVNIRYDRNLETGLSLSGPGNFESGNQAKITVENSKGDYLKNLTAVTVYKPSGATERVFAQGVGNFYDEYYQVSNDNVLIIVDNKGNIFDEDGEYTISLDAQYYNRLTTEQFTVTGKLETAPAAVSASKDSDGNYVVHFDDSNAYAWKDKWTSVTVNETAYDAAGIGGALNNRDYKWSVGTNGGYDLTLQANAFDQEENTIVIKATGYNDTTIKVTSEGSLVGAPEDPAEEAKPAPAAPTATVDEAGNVTLAFADTVEWEYRNAVTEVTVNDTAYSKFDDITGNPGEKQYEWQESQSQGIDALYLDKISFVTGENTVVIKAEGYKDLTVTVKIDGEEEPGDTIKDVPEVTYKNYGHGTAYLYIDNGSMSSTDGANYIKAISRITVDGTEYFEAWGNSPSANEYATSSSTPYIAFTGSTFSSEKDTVVVVEAEGYKTLTVTVHADGSITTSIADPGASDEEQPSDGKDAPAVKSSEKVYYSGNYILHFENNVDSNWETAIKSGKATVVVNDTTYAFKSSTLLVDDNNYAWTNYGDPQLTLDPTAFTKEKNTITISAEGYKDLTITIGKDGSIV